MCVCVCVRVRGWGDNETGGLIIPNAVTLIKEEVGREGVANNRGSNQSRIFSELAKVECLLGEPLVFLISAGTGHFRSSYNKY